jgi:hypothetical protein
MLAFAPIVGLLLAIKALAAPASSPDTAPMHKRDAEVTPDIPVVSIETFTASAELRAELEAVIAQEHAAAYTATSDADVDHLEARDAPPMDCYHMDGVSDFDLSRVSWDLITTGNPYWDLGFWECRSRTYGSASSVVCNISRDRSGVNQQQWAGWNLAIYHNCKQRTGAGSGGTRSKAISSHSSVALGDPARCHVGT